MSVTIDPRRATESAAALAVQALREQHANAGSLATFMQRMYPGYLMPRHIRLIMRELEHAAATPDSRLMIIVPRRHGKSLLASEHFPAWVLGRFPEKRVVGVSHTRGLAFRFSHRVRQKFRHKRWPFSRVRIAKDRGAVEQWDIAGSLQGGYAAFGMGGSPTGLGADLLMIDDPIGSREDAMSASARQAVYDSYQGTLRPTLNAGGSIILVSCMVGDTNVTMADGTTKRLRNIGRGDHVATYEHGHVTSAPVLNWINHGPDSVHEIRTKSGKVIKANERHPFLVDRGGKTEWIRLRNLKVGDRLVGVNTVASHVHLTIATNPPNARDIARLTTTRRDGRTVIDLPRSIPHPVETFACVAGMELASPNTMHSSRRREGDARFVENCQAPKTCRSIGRESSASTIVTTREKYGGFSAIHATLPLGMVGPKSDCSRPLDTFEIIPDEITEIISAGREDVFDIEVERTGNFIADGVVSHNTRWHHDDLAGRLMAEQAHGGEEWRVIHLDAVCEDPAHDPLDREEGEALWPELWPVESLAKIRAAVGEDWWQSQFQGRPNKPGGDMIKLEWFLPYDRVPEYANKIIQSWDTAFKTGKQHDYSVCVTAAVGAHETYILDVFQARLEWPALQRAYVQQTRAWQPAESLIEDRASGTSLIQWARSPECPTRAPVIDMPANHNLEFLVNEVSPSWEGHRVKIPTQSYWRDAFLAELGNFPNDAHDDQVAAIAHLTYRLYNQRQGSSVTSTSYIEGAGYPDDEEEEFELWQRRRFS